MVALTRVTPSSGTETDTETNARDLEPEHAHEPMLRDLLAPLLAEFARHRPEDDSSMIVAAGRTAAGAHEGQFRRSGEPYITHPIAVATIVAELGLDEQTVAAALLHDAVEDTGLTLESIEETFGEGVARVVDGVTKLDRLQFNSKEAQQAATIRKMLVAMADDWRVLLIKLADRLHNMRTLAVMPEWKQRRTAQETFDVYAPLAHRLGVQQVRWQLEDLAFATLHPKRYAEIEQMVAARAPQREEYLERVLVHVRQRMNDMGVVADVTGRPKHLWSIYEKMVVRGKEFDDINDLVAIRVVVESEKDCWAALGAIHAIWAPVQGRFKDYINTPKFNMYQSLHTTVIGLDGKPVEVQIRTSEMHHRAEYGIAAHWGYKSKEDHSSEMAWLQRIADVDRQTDDPIEFLEALKLDLEQDEVYVFTPKGKVIALPARSTPVDFAYAIHTEVGHRFIGARVNGRLVPLETQLSIADTVEIITSKSPTAGPSRDWLQIVASTRARNKIRQWFSRERREDAIENGREELARALRRDGLPLHKLLGSSALQQVADAMNLADLDALYASIGENQVSAQSIVQRLTKALRGGGEADEQLPTVALPGTTPAAAGSPHRHGRLRRGARRRHDPPGPLLHPGAGRPDRGLRDPGPGRVGAPGRLRQRGGVGRPLPGAPHGGRVGPGQRRRLRGDDRGAGLRPGPPAGRRVPGRLRAPPQHRRRPHRHDAGPGQPDGLRRRAGRPDTPAFTDQRVEASRWGVRRVSSAPWQESLTPDP